MSAELVEIIVDVHEQDLNIHNPYSLTETEMTTEVQLSQEKGIGSSSQIRSPTVSNSLCPPIVELICFQCEKRFNRYGSEFRKRAHDNIKTFCCRECWLEHKKKDNVIVECNRCKSPIELRISVFNKSKSKIFHCNRECQKEPHINCDWCGESFYKKPSEISITNFCSKKCCTAYQVGEGNPNWRGGHERYYGSDWNSQRNKARKRDNNTCQDCGKTDDYRLLDVHHIIPFKIFGLKNHKEANRLSNLITLCHTCHMAEEVSQ